MRESNFRSVPSNRASVSITASLYDRRALDCSSDKPLINSLYHLSTLASNSARVRETLCVDGGLERLVAILKSCRRPDKSEMSMSNGSDSGDVHATNTTTADNNNDNIDDTYKSSLIAFKWILALQCLVFLGTRGTETVRRRVVEAGVVPVIATILDNYLQTMDCTKQAVLESSSTARCSKSTTSAHAHALTTAPSRSMASASASASASTLSTSTSIRDSQARGQSSSYAPSLASSFMSTASTASASASTMSVASASTAATEPLDFALSQDSYSSQQQQQQQQQQQSSSQDTEVVEDTSPNVAERSTQRSSSAVGGSFATNVLQASAIASATASVANSGSSNNGSASSADGSAYALAFNRIPLHSQASNAVFHAHARGNVSSRADRQEQRQPFNENLQENIQEDVQSFPNAQAEVLMTGSSRLDVPSVPQPPQPPQVLQTSQIPEVPEPPQAPQAPAIVDVRSTSPESDANVIPQRFNTENTNPGAESTVNASPTTGTTSASARNFHNNVMIPREEDVIWSLEILAFVSKYAYLRHDLQASHLVPQISVRDPTEPPLMKSCFLKKKTACSCDRDQDQDCDDDNYNRVYDNDSMMIDGGEEFEHHSQQKHDDHEKHSAPKTTDRKGKRKDHHHSHKQHHRSKFQLVNMTMSEEFGTSSEESSDLDYDSYDFEQSSDIDIEYMGETINVFPLVEKFTLRMFPRDMQYWAGVIMRNSCRKDDTKGGIRQCANFECGKWELFPRQFAKCRRCKRTKYCSKECQLSAWGYHRHWCISSNSSSSASSGVSNTTCGSQTQSSHSQQHSSQSGSQPGAVDQTATTTNTASSSSAGAARLSRGNNATNGLNNAVGTSRQTLSTGTLRGTLGSGFSAQSSRN